MVSDQFRYLLILNWQPSYFLSDKVFSAIKILQEIAVYQEFLGWAGFHLYDLFGGWWMFDNILLSNTCTPSYLHNDFFSDIFYIRNWDKSTTKVFRVDTSDMTTIDWIQEKYGENILYIIFKANKHTNICYFPFSVALSSRRQGSVLTDTRSIQTEVLIMPDK